VTDVDVTDFGGSGNLPFRIASNSRRRSIRHIDRPPAVDAMERYLTRVFLSRYVTSRARRQRYAQLQGAARLLGEINKV